MKLLTAQSATDGSMRNSGNLVLFALANAAGVSLELVPLEMGKDNLTDSFRRNISPLGNIPAAQLEDGSYLFESAAILRCILRYGAKAGKNLYGSTIEETAKIDAFIDFAKNELKMDLYYQTTSYGSGMSEESIAEKMANLHYALASLETILETKTMIVGERITGADIVLGSLLHYVLGRMRQSSEFWKYKNVVRYYHTVFYNAPNNAIAEADKRDFGTGAPVTKPAEYKAPKKVEEKPKPAAAAASAAAEEEPKPEENKKKPGWQLEALPESKGFLGQGLDEWKRQYSNVKDTAKSTAWLFDNFDADGYTMWFCKYKYNEECKMQFQTANLTRGWFQRMEGVRKYAFGTALILGEATNHEIQGHWIFRQGGNMQEKQGFDGLPECIREVEDISLYEWKQIDVKNISADEKLLIQNFLEWDGKALPRPCLEGRTFK